MYKSKFSTRKEAYDYTTHLLKTSKNKLAVVRNYANILAKQPTPRPTVQMVKSKEVIIYRAFEYTIGNTSTDKMIIHENGVIDI